MLRYIPTTLLLAGFATVAHCAKATTTANAITYPTAGVKFEVGGSAEISWFINEETEPGDVGYNLTLFIGTEAIPLDTEEPEGPTWGSNTYIWYPGKDFISSNDYTAQVIYDNFTLTSEKFAILGGVSSTTSTSATATSTSRSQSAPTVTVTAGVSSPAASSSAAASATTTAVAKSSLNAGIIGRVVGGIVVFVFLVASGVFLLLRWRRQSSGVTPIPNDGEKSEQTPPMYGGYGTPMLDGNQRVEMSAYSEPVELNSMRVPAELA